MIGSKFPRGKRVKSCQYVFSSFFLTKLEARIDLKLKTLQNKAKQSQEYRIQETKKEKKKISP